MPWIDWSIAVCFESEYCTRNHDWDSSKLSLQERNVFGKVSQLRDSIYKEGGWLSWLKDYRLNSWHLKDDITGNGEDPFFPQIILSDSDWLGKPSGRPPSSLPHLLLRWNIRVFFSACSFCLKISRPATSMLCSLAEWVCPVAANSSAFCWEQFSSSKESCLFPPFP